MTSLRSLAWISTLSGVLAAAIDRFAGPDNNLAPGWAHYPPGCAGVDEPDCICVSPLCKALQDGLPSTTCGLTTPGCVLTTATFSPTGDPDPVCYDYYWQRSKAIKVHFAEWGSDRQSQHSCGAAVYQVSDVSDFAGGLGWLAHRDNRHHIFDGVLNVHVDGHKLGDTVTSDFPFILESYLENHFCEEAHLYINLPNKKDFAVVEDKITETALNKVAADALTAATWAVSEEDKAKVEKDARETEISTRVQNYFHNNAIYQHALPGLLRNKHIKKLVVHRVVGFTHASFGDMISSKNHKHKAITATTLHDHLLRKIFDKAHVMDPVEFDLKEYRKDAIIQICENTPQHEACSATDKKEWHSVLFTKPYPQSPKPDLPFKTKGLTRFVDDMYISLAAEYQNVLQSPNGGKGESFRDVWSESQKSNANTRTDVYKERVQALNSKQTPTGSGIDWDLTHVATEGEWPSIFTSVATTIQKGMRTEGSAGLYEKYVVGGDISRLLPLLALGIPFLMYR